MRLNPPASVPIQQMDYVIVDVETTGGSSQINRIIELAAIHYRDGIIYKRFATLINPGQAIPPWITDLTGIDNSMVQFAPTFSEIADELLTFLNRGIFVAHNVMFDYGFIQAAFRRADKVYESPQLCTLKLARRLYKELASRSLSALCEHLMIEIEDRHRAYGDAEATVYILKHMLDKLGQEHGITRIPELHAFLERKKKKTSTTPVSS